MAPKYPLECFKCDKRIHRRCVPMSPGLLKEWSGEGLEFLCPSCVNQEVGGTGAYDVSAALKRLAKAVNDPRSGLSARAATEKLLLRTYNVRLPDRPTNVPTGPVDEVATKVLRQLHPIVLGDHTPLAVQGDGNCLYRALSRHEDHHRLIRLLTALEMSGNPSFYDTSAPDYKDLVQDNRVFSDPFSILLIDVANDGQYSQTLHLYAASAALGHTIRSYCPPNRVVTDYVTDPLNRRVCGRGVSTNKEPAVTIMWSQCEVPTTSADFRPNHFVVLSKVPCTDIHVDLASRLEKNYENDFPPLPTPVSPLSPACTPPTSLPQSPRFNERSPPEPVSPCIDSHVIDELIEIDNSLDSSRDDTIKQQNNTPESDISIDNSNDIVQGSIELPLGPKGKHKFLDVEDIVGVLNSEHEQTTDYVPRGTKDNINNNNNNNNTKSKSKSFISP